jgi:hypothetical protein
MESRKNDGRRQNKYRTRVEMNKDSAVARTQLL